MVVSIWARLHKQSVLFSRGHTVWLCTESLPKNGQGYYAVRRGGLIMDLLLASPPIDLKYGCDLNRFISHHTPPSYPPLSIGLKDGSDP